MKNLTRWEPLSVMRRWEPFDELRTLQREMDRLFDHFLGAEVPSERTGALMPSVESFIKDGILTFKAELPGVDPKNLEVSIDDRELVIKGERKNEKDTKEEHYLYREISYGSFERRFLLPEGAKSDELKARFVNGVLEITVPAPAISKARKVEIEAPKEERKLVDADVRKAA